MNIPTFAKIADSLRQYRRADLREFAEDIGESPVDRFYVDPLPNEGVLRSVLSSNTTFLLGRKGTGKSTVFAKAQSEIRKNNKTVSVYIDVKSLFDVVTSEDGGTQSETAKLVDAGVIRAHLFRKHFLGAVISQLLNEFSETIKNLSFVSKVFGAKKKYLTLIAKLAKLGDSAKNAKLKDSEIPVLREITRKLKVQSQQETTKKEEMGASMGVSLTNANLKAQSSAADFDRTLEDTEVYNEYSDVVLRSFPFQEILTQIQELLAAYGLNKLVAFFDDFSELKFFDQKLFVDVVLSPLNNSSNDKIKLKIAGYPGRVYYGKIDPSKVDTITLDFSSLYEASEVQTMEYSAIDYAERLLRARFEAYGENVQDYFESSTPIAEHFRTLFQTTFNVPRIMGTLLHFCYLDRISKQLPVTQQSLRLASQKYFESTVTQYFDRTNRFALEPFETKLDRHNQKELLNCLVTEARRVRKGIQDGTIGGQYFSAIQNPPTSHFIVSPLFDSVFQSLESNFFLTRYKATRDKNASHVIVYALYHGLTEVERMSWGYPDGRSYRNYFVQRCFDYTSTVHEFLKKRKTIRCNSCGRSFPLEQKDSFEMFKWKCPECNEGPCSIVDIRDDFDIELGQIMDDSMLEEVELLILNVLFSERRAMRSVEISLLLDVTYQLVGKRTTKLREMGLVLKTKNEKGSTHNEITEKAIDTYFKSSS
jgi:hypothetical protein